MKTVNEFQLEKKYYEASSKSHELYKKLNDLFAEKHDKNSCEYRTMEQDFFYWNGVAEGIQKVINMIK